jgi:hypothetical protein
MLMLEVAVRCRNTSSGVGVVDQIVMHERGRLEDLQRCTQVPQCVRLGRALRMEVRDRAPSGVAEPCTQTLSPLQRGRCGRDEHRRIRTVRGRL